MRSSRTVFRRREGLECVRNPLIEVRSDEFPGDQNSVGNRPRVRTAMRDDRDSVDTQKWSATILGVVELLPKTADHLRHALLHVRRTRGGGRDLLVAAEEVAVPSPTLNVKLSEPL